MTVQGIQRLYHTRPFKPFTIHLADGQAIPVEHPEFMASAPSGQTIVVYQLDSSFDIIDLSLVTALKVKPDSSSPDN